MSMATKQALPISMDSRRKLYLLEKKFKRALRSNRRLVWFVIVLFILNCVYGFNRSLENRVVFELDDEYAGTYKEKFLNSIRTEADITDDFYDKVKVMNMLDDLVNEPIDQPTFNVSINPLQIIKDRYPKPDIFNQLDLATQAGLYVNDILPNSNYKFRPIQDSIYKDIYYPKKYVKDRVTKWNLIKKYFSDEELANYEITDELFKSTLMKTKEAKSEFNKRSATEISNALSHLKLFAKYVIKPTEIDSVGYVDKEAICKTASQYLFPWLSGFYPTFTKYSKRFEASRVRAFDESDDNKCMALNLRDGLKGKGIVITAADGLVPELTGLLASLRLLNTELPIQIVHNHDLSLPSIKKLVEVAHDPIMRLPKSNSGFKAPSKIPPTLDITFVDVTKTIGYKYQDYFQRWGMKLLAYLFNSFEEMILLDTDTVPLIPIENYFNLPSYKETQTLFFRDREANSFLYDGVMDFFISFLPNDDDYKYLQLRTTTKETLNNRFFGEKARHFMEAGLFAINKKSKFDGVLTAVSMQYFKLISGSVHGEKEFIWLGQEITGNTYRFNKYPAISVGELSEDTQLKSHELCSTHPGHLSDDKSLLWFNSGFLNCKKPESFYKDINFERNEGKTLGQLKKEYQSHLHITHGLIPPPAEYSLQSAEHPEEPSRGWVMTSHCENYLWCAYDVIGFGESESIPKGDIIKFSSTDSLKWDYFGEVWVSYFNVGKGGKIDSGIVEDDAYDELGLSDDDENDELKSFKKGGFASNSGDFAGAGARKAAISDSGASSSGSLRIKKPKKGGAAGSGGSASELDYEEYEDNRSANGTETTSKKSGKKNTKFSVDADFIDDADSSSSISKGFKETDDDYENRLQFDSFPSSPSSSSRKKTSGEPNENSSGFSSWWNLISGGDSTTKEDKSSKLNSFGSDSEIDIEDLAAKKFSDETDGETGGDILGKELLENLNKENTGEISSEQEEAARLKAEASKFNENEEHKDLDGDGKIDEETNGEETKDEEKSSHK